MVKCKVYVDEWGGAGSELRKEIYKTVVSFPIIPQVGQFIDLVDFFSGLCRSEDELSLLENDAVGLIKRIIISPDFLVIEVVIE